MREIRNMSKLNHPNVIKILDWYVKGSEILIVQEFANAGNLGELVAKNGGKLTVKLLKQLLKDTL